MHSTWLKEVALSEISTQGELTLPDPHLIWTHLPDRDVIVNNRDWNIHKYALSLFNSSVVDIDYSTFSLFWNRWKCRLSCSVVKHSDSSEYSCYGDVRLCVCMCVFCHFLHGRDQPIAIHFIVWLYIFKGNFWEECIERNIGTAFPFHGKVVDECIFC